MSRMDPLNIEGCQIDDSEDVKDEQMLLDFHLGNAINLDVIEHLVSKTSPPYPLYVPRYMRQSWGHIQSLLSPEYQNEIGFLNISCLLFSLPSRRSIMRPKLYKTLTSIIGRSLKKRGVEIPISEHHEAINEFNILIKSTYDRLFNRIMKSIICLSERVRGGERSIYPEVELEGQLARTLLLPNEFPVELIVGRNISVIIDNLSKKNYIGNYDSVLLLLDTLGQRMCMEIGCQVTLLTKTPGTVNLLQLHEIISIGDQILITMGNEGYEVLGLFEATVVAVILKKSPDDITDSSLFYNNCMDELLELIQDKSYEAKVLELWSKMIETLHGIDCNILSNIFCLYRIWGHPRVNILTGMQKVYEKGTADKFTLSQSSNVSLCQFRHMFLSSYYNRKKSYPPVRMDIIPNSYILTRIGSGLPVNPRHPGYNVWDYLHVDIGQVWTVPETYDVCHILNDKAVSPTRSELYKSIRDGHGTIAGVLRRGIIRWMEGDSIRCKDFLQEVNDHGLEDEHLIIGMYEKEREIKVKARMFSLMSEKMRMYFVLTEELIANHILPYFPEITMKDPLNVQIRKIWKAGGKGQNPLNPNINIDFEKWNLNMRPSFTDPIFQQIDRMFGFQSLISRTHEIFRESYIYSCSGKYLPQINSEGFVHEPPMSYSGHLGGFEGLRQKGWTVATVSLLAYTAWANKVQMCLLGQGDNQVLKLYMPVKKWDGLCYTYDAKIRACKEILSKYIDDMHLSFQDAGLPIKIRETWVSTRLFMYGKSMYLDGKCLPQWAKKLLRSYALSNEGTLTISGVIGTIATNMNAAASVSEHPDIMYVLYLFMAEWSLEYMLNYHPFTRGQWKSGGIYEFKIPGYNAGRMMKTPPMILSRLMATLILIPTAVGGSVNIPLTGYIMRGFPDHASEGYTWIKLLMSVDSPFKSMFENWYTFLKNPSIEPDMLVQSPWSLNHLKPPTPGLQSRELIRDWLLSGRFPKNKFLKNMGVIHRSFDRKNICHELMTDPINPLITYEVYNAFPHTYYDSVLRRFEGTRSVRKLALREHYTKPIVKKLMEIEDMYISYLIWRNEAFGSKFSDCATAHTRMARDIGWGRTIHGLTTPHPLEFLYDQICYGYSPECDGSDFILAKYAQGGEYPPYLGSRVKTKVISLQDESARVEPLICANARLARYLKWINAGPNLFQLILTSTSSLCNVDIYDNFFDDDMGGENYTGCIEHRFNPAAASDGCFINYVPQIGANVYLSGDHMPKYGKGKENYTLHFQAIYCFLQYVTAMGPHSRSTHHHIVCEECIVKCEDDINDICSDHPNIDQAFSADIIPILRETIGYIHEKPYVIGGGIKPELPGIHREIQDDPHINTRAYYGALQLLAVRCASAILLKSYGDQGLGIDDLQAFPRVYSYKIYTDHILKATAEVILYMQALYSGEQPEGYVLQRIKRNAKRAIDNATIDKFKEIGSLCLGRIWSGKKTIIGPIPCSSYPESPEEFLRATRYMLLQYLDEIGEFSMWIPKVIALPKYDCTEREHKLILGLQSYRYERCWSCGLIGVSLNPVHKNMCREGHVPVWLNRIIILKATLDRMMKLASVKKQRVYQIAALPYISSTQIIEYTEGDDRRDPFDRAVIHRRQITLPTSSIYKWTSVLSTIEDTFDHVIVLGDGTGGTSLIASTHWKEATIHPMSKMEHYRAIPQDSISIAPYLSRNCPNVSHELMYALDDDVTSTGWTERLTEAITRMGGSILIISDIERGLEEYVHNIMKIICKSHPLNYIVKRYERNWKCPPNETIIYTPHANIEYGEIFVANFKPEIQRGILQRSFLEETLIIESCFKDITLLSLHLAQQHVSKLYLNIKRSLLLGPSDKIMSNILAHLNSRYRFPQDRIKAGDKRNITDGILIRLVRGVKILLLSLTSEGVKEEEWFQSLCIIRCSKANRIPILRKHKIIISSDRYGFAPMDDKDILAARCIRGHRTELISLSSIRDVYSKLIIPEMFEHPQIEPPLDIQDTDPAETLEDL